MELTINLNQVIRTAVTVTLSTGLVWAMYAALFCIGGVV